MSKIHLMGLPITSGGSSTDVINLMETFFRAPRKDKAYVISFVNPHAYWLLKHHKPYHDLIESCDSVFCDGVGVVIAAKVLGNNTVSRISFDSTSLAPLVFDFCQKNNVSVYLIGGIDGVTKNAASIIKDHWDVNVVGWTHGFHNDYLAVFDEIKRSNAGVVVCGMGAPYQESFLLSLKSSGWVGIGFSCGGYLDQLCESGKNYYPSWIDRHNLRFIYRIYKEPKRLFRRYFWEYGVFFQNFIKELLVRRGR